MIWDWTKITAGLVAIVRWFQRAWQSAQDRQAGRNERDAETYQKVILGKEARDLVGVDPDYTNKLLGEITVGSRDKSTDDGQLLLELRTRLRDSRDSQRGPAWRVEKLRNVEKAVYPYARSSLGKLETCHGELQLIALELTRGVIVPAWDVTVVCGTRSLAKQQEAYDSGASKVKPGHSKHNSLPSNAIDMVPAQAPRLWAEGKDLPSKTYYDFAEDVFIVADHYGIDLRWGGDWDGDKIYNDQTFNDFAHFERRT